MQMSSKTCVLDPIPASSLFQCSDETVPLLITIVKQSLSAGIFPSCMKAATVKARWKKSQTLLTPMCLKTLCLFQICPLHLNLVRKLFLITFFVIWIKTIFGTASSQLIAQNTVVRQDCFVFSMTSCRLQILALPPF